MEATHASTRNQHKESETLHFVLHLAGLGFLQATNKGQNMQPALTRSPLWLTTLKNYSADFTLQMKCSIFKKFFQPSPLRAQIDLSWTLFARKSGISAIY